MIDCQFKTVGIIGKYDDTDISLPLELILAVLNRYQCSVLLDELTIAKQNGAEKNYETCDRESLSVRSDLVISIGGDGSFLTAGRSMIAHAKPIIGVNMGRLGFLTDISPNEIDEILPEIISGEFKEEKRSVIQSKVYRNDKLLASHIAINDVVVHKSSVARMIELDVFLDNIFLSSYRADGLILSTSTGSTAYALSSGGPIVQANIPAFIIVPICPHTLMQRPLVTDSNAEVKVLVPLCQETALQLTIDGQEELELQAGDVIYLTKYPKDLHIYHPKNYDGLSRLRKKLGWGSQLSRLK